jgi:membrane protease subunit HflC
MKTRLLLLLLAVAALMGLSASTYIVQETEQVILTEFGKPTVEPVTRAGLYFKRPFIQAVNRLPKQILAWDGQGTEMATRDKLYIRVETFARWRISRPLEYFRRLRDERSALSRLDDILGSETRNAVAKHDLIELIRTTKDRQPTRDETMKGAVVESSKIGVLHPINRGRQQIERDIEAAAKPKLADLGIELLDLRFKRVNYNSSVVEKIYERMISERQQIASRFRSEGEGEAAKILGNKARDLNVIESEAYKAVETIRGNADAKATAIYAAAYSKSPEARSLYGFVKTMETYKKVIGPETSLVFSTAGDLFRYLDDSSGAR